MFLYAKMEEKFYLQNDCLLNRKIYDYYINNNYTRFIYGINIL